MRYLKEEERWKSRDLWEEAFPEDSREFDDYYLIQPEAFWWKKRTEGLGGKPVPHDFSYNSGNNTQWLSVDDMKALIGELNAD